VVRTQFTTPKSRSKSHCQIWVADTGGIDQASTMLIERASRMRPPSRCNSRAIPIPIPIVRATLTPAKIRVRVRTAQNSGLVTI
jgi:hypothetical protein